MSVFDIDQLSMLLELEAPYGADDLQLARRRMAKRWHPDIAPAGQRQAHEDHLKAVNAAADQIESFLGQMPGGVITASVLKTSAESAQRRRAEEGRRNYERQKAEAERASADRDKNDPFRAQVPDHSVVYRYARCNAYPEWGVGSILGIYFIGEGDDVQQWGRVSFEIGVRTVPASTLSFVEFGTPDNGKERARRFLVSAEHAMSEGDFALAARRLIFARDADEQDPTIHRLMTVAFWQCGDLDAAARSVRQWARVEPGRPAPHRYAARLYEAMSLIELAAESAERECATNPADATAWARLGSFRLRLLQPEAAVGALTRARSLPEGESVDLLLNLALGQHLLGDSVRSLEASHAATELDPNKFAAWQSYAIALDRAGRLAECIDACDRALAVGESVDIAALRARKISEQPSEIERAA